MHVYGPTSVHGPHPIQGPHQARAGDASARSKQSAPVDQLDISDTAIAVNQINELPEIRHDKVAAIKAEIASGAYETPEKLDVALDRLLDEIA